MNQQLIKALLTIAIVAVGIVVLIQFIINKYTKSVMLIKLVPFLKKQEGGLSRAKTDTASKYPAPWAYKGHSDWHTNKGITYQTFKSNGDRLGYDVTAENFFSMPDEIWGKILTGVYMSAFPLSEIDHLPRIQAVITTWAWGSGVSGSTTRLANFQREKMGIKDSNITASEIVKNFNEKINSGNEKEWFLELCQRREEDFRKMSTFTANGRGWLNRLEEFKKLFE